MSTYKRLAYRFVSELSLIAGSIILAVAILSLRHVAFFPDMRWMMGSQLSGHVFAASLVGIVSGLMLIIGGIMIFKQPIHIRKWGILVWFFSSLSFFGIGGFLVGGILGILAGFLAVTKGITFFDSKTKSPKK